MKKLLAIALSAFALCANATTVKMASEDWVRRQFAKLGIRVSLAVSHTNANGTVTITSPFSDPEHPSARSIQLTFTPMVLRARTPRVAFSWTSLLFPSAYAGESDVGQVITMTIQSGSWTEAGGFTHEFDFGPNGMTLEDQNGETFPEIPETSHTHRIESGGDCLCEYSKMSDSEIAAEAEDNYPFPDMSYYADRNNWFDMSNWPSDRMRVRGNRTWYFIADETGELFDLDEVMKTDAFLDGMQACKQKIEEHQKLCREKYKQACQCDDAGPHHQYVTTETWDCGSNHYTKKVCQRNASHTEETGSKTHDYAGQSWTDNGSNHKKTCKGGHEYQTEGHSYGDWADGGSVHTHTCTSCPHQESASHTFGAWYETGRSNGYIHERRDCSACPKYETRDTPDPQDPPMCTANNHVPNSDGTCGCLCGYYTPGATVTLTNCGRTVGVESSEERYHHWDESVTDSFGNPNCLCQCTKYHRMRTASAYQTNQRKACPGICAYCDRKTTSGLNIADCDDNYHTPCQASDGHCGCLGGKLTAGNCEIKRFHIRKPGTCRCLGADGNGGSWHFKQEKAGCTQICSCDTEWGGEHLVCAAADMEQRTPTRTTPSNHTKYEGGRCGCKCGKYTNSNYADWASANLHNSNPYDCGCYCTHASVTQISPYHYWASGNCWCNCKDTAKDSLKQHHKVDGACANVCYGNNHGSGYYAGMWHYLDEAGKAAHDPAGGMCGCKCRTFVGEDYPKSYVEFHNGHNSEYRCCAAYGDFKTKR